MVLQVADPHSDVISFEEVRRASKKEVISDEYRCQRTVDTWFVPRPGVQPEPCLTGSCVQCVLQTLHRAERS